MRVIELFAGVGGFRKGLEAASKDDFDFVWANQWEPSTKRQDAYEHYVRAFGNGKINVEGELVDEVSNTDISKVDVKLIPDHDMLVGGFPCQDYSVASTLARSGGIEGKKGVLWWEIERILKTHRTQAEYLFLENVDRLLNSPAKQRGRDFAIMLSTLSNLGYYVEWRVINGADYGKVQRRRRTYILAYKKESVIGNEIAHSTPFNYILNESVMAKAFPVEADTKKKIQDSFIISRDVLEVSNTFGKGRASSQFENCGIMVDNKVFTVRTSPVYNGEKGYATLRDILLPENEVPEEYYISEDDLPKWKYQKGPKKEKRINKTTGFEYQYSEGGMSFPDDIDKPSRTIITGEGGKGPSRFKHVVEVIPGHFRRLTPVELERLDGFPDNHTQGSSDIRRAFLMGNALIVSVVEEIGKSLISKLRDYGKV